jgi:pyruvyltransferase
MNPLSKTVNHLKAPIGVYWWRLDVSGPGNFGDEVTRCLIPRLFGRRVRWASPDNCDLVGAGSVLSEVYQNKKDNTPYVWGSGFIEEDTVTVDTNDFRFLSVRGNITRNRIKGIDKGAKISLGDPGLLASHLHTKRPQKRYKLGILPHYVDADDPFVATMAQLPDVLIIDARWDPVRVAAAISECESLLSSSLHGLIFADSVGPANVHLQISDKLKGRDYKFRDYYSVFENTERYNRFTVEDVKSYSPEKICSSVQEIYCTPKDLSSIQETIIAAFPF